MRAKSDEKGKLIDCELVSHNYECVRITGREKRRWTSERPGGVAVRCRYAGNGCSKEALRHLAWLMSSISAQSSSHYGGTQAKNRDKGQHYKQGPTYYVHCLPVGEIGAS